MSIERICQNCDAEYDTRHGKCPACGSSPRSSKPKAQRQSRVRLQRVVSEARPRRATTKLIPRAVSETKAGLAAKMEQLKAQLNERRIKEMDAMLTDAGVPQWVENQCHRGVPSNSTVMRLKWYLARRKNVAAGEIDQKLQREMKAAEEAARHYMKAASAPPCGERARLANSARERLGTNDHE